MTTVSQQRTLSIRADLDQTELFYGLHEASVLAWSISLPTGHHPAQSVRGCVVIGRKENCQHANDLLLSRDPTVVQPDLLHAYVHEFTFVIPDSQIPNSSFPRMEGQRLLPAGDMLVAAVVWYDQFVNEASTPLAAWTSFMCVPYSN
jgi:hypothetical protein